MTNQHMAPGVEIRFDQKTEVISSTFGTRKPDKDWVHFDSHGHAHAWKKDKLPTLYEKVTGKTWVGEFDGYEVDVTEFRCRACSEVVEPKYAHDYSPVYVEGPPSYTLVLHASMFDQEYRIPDDDVRPLIEILQRVFGG